jgi:YVTN family beta-propeller protein
VREHELPSGAVTFLFTDIEGSTRLVRQLRARYAQVLVEHQRLLREAFAQYDGHEIDTQGDAFFYAFPSAHSAVLAAVEGQRALAAFPWPSGISVKVRMGIHTGQATPVDGRYTGLGVHRAARICTAGHGGQILVSQATQSLLEDEEEELAVNLRDLGERRLKDIDRPVRLYQVAAQGLRSSFPPVRQDDEPNAGSAPAAPPFRRPFILALAAVTVLVAVAAAVLATRSGGGGLRRVHANAVGIIDPDSNRVVGEVPVGVDPGPLAIGPGVVWVGNAGDRTLTRIDSSTREVVRTVSLQATPTGLAVSRGAVWVVHGRLGLVTRVDPAFNRVAETIDPKVGRSSGGAIDSGAGSVWVTFAGHEIAYVGRIDAESSRITAEGYPAGRPSAIAVAEDAVWIANGDDSNTISRIHPQTATAVETITVGRGPKAIAVGAGAVWVANSADGTVSRVDPGASSSGATIRVGDTPSAIAVGEGAVWVANAGDGTVSRIDPRTGDVTRTIKVGGRPEGLAVGAGSVWVAVQRPNA